MATRVFNFHICEVHEDIIGLESPNTDYLSKCSGHQACGWESDSGTLILDSNDIVIVLFYPSWVEENIKRGNYSFFIDSVFGNLYDKHNEIVEIKGISQKVKDEYKINYHQKDN